MMHARIIHEQKYDLVNILLAQLLCMFDLFKKYNDKFLKDKL